MPGAVLPNMSITLPTLGGDSGTWDSELNDALGVIDVHDHTSGKGVQIPVAAIDINADLPMDGFGFTGVKSVAFAQIAALTAGAVTLYVDTSNHELYWRTAGGVNVKLTAGSSINTTLVGGIVGDYSSVGALLAYDDANHRYTFEEPSGKWAYIASADVRLYQFDTNESVYVALKAPDALSAPYTITFPTAVPGSQVLLQMDASGNLIASNTIPGAVTTTVAGHHVDVLDYPVPLQPVAAFITNAGYSGDHISVESTGTNWDFRTQVIQGLRAGDRILGVYQASSFTGTMTLRLDKIASGTASSTGCTVTMVSGTSAILFDTSYTLGANEQVYIDVSGSDNSAALKQLIIHVDRP